MLCVCAVSFIAVGPFLLLSRAGAVDPPSSVIKRAYNHSPLVWKIIAIVERLIMIDFNN